jgi:diguanylate cyclase (GGDEF)-like protein/putative nucleotidyltransferase with HDIG domain
MSVGANKPTALPVMSPAAHRFQIVTIAVGAAVLAEAAVHWSSADLVKYALFLAAALVMAGSRINLSGYGAFSAGFVVVLFGVSDLSASETVLLAAVNAAVAAIVRRKHGPLPFNVLFQVAVTSAAAATAVRAYQSAWLLEDTHPLVRLAGATLAMFVVNTGPRALFVAMDEGRRFIRTWHETSFWSLPYYLGAAALAHGMALASSVAGWQTVLLSGPVMYLIYRSYRLYLHRLEAEKRHAEEMASLHLRTIEALALAIDAKDHTTHEHLRRVQVYAEEMANALGLDNRERQALQAAALLHDIGKLAVPEHIISKPGRLTPEEFEKMKIHPIVGAEILERVRFPYPVAPIVRAHHEKWDGTGYPNGLRGEQIPIGARILAAVDCLDALASDRQYRRALPLDEAMKVVAAESGKAFDPRIVEILAANYVQWEQKAQRYHPARQAKLSKDVKVELGAAPAAGFEAAAGRERAAGEEEPMDFLTMIAAARAEVQTLFEISQDLGSSLSLDETLSVLNVRLRRIIPHHALAIWLRRGDFIEPVYVNGEDYRLFSSLRIPLGQGLSGWVAENGKPIVNGNPSVEPGYLNDPTQCSMLRSAVAVPLEGPAGIVGVIALYHMERDAFTRDHLRILSGISTRIAVAVDNALKFHQVESSATTDYVTSLPNARSLFLQLDTELARARRNNQPMTVMVLDMDGLKSINDRFGHLEGNRILGAVAAGLKSSCREYDYVARMGGDEFVMLIPGVKLTSASPRLDHIRNVVAQAGSGLMLERPLSISIGVAVFPDDGSDAEKLLSEADRRMYQEKRARKEAFARDLSRDWVANLAAIHVQ